LSIDVIGFRGVGIRGASVISIALGRAMHDNADLIALDEPTAAKSAPLTQNSRR
jgi:ABC-type sugar transport system ATPase subunit